MPEPFVVTVTGEQPASTLGVIDAHDHLFIASPGLRGGEIEDPDKVEAEMLDARATGLRTIVEMTPIGLGRRPDLMRRASEATSMPVIAATGYHRDSHYPAGHWVYDATVETLADRVLADLARGMHPNDWEGDLPLDRARAGAIKGGASYQRISKAEHRRLEACAAGSRDVGVAVLVHTEIGTFGHEVVDLLEAGGARPEKIALAHLDRNPDLDLHAEIAARGVTLEYDTMGRIKYGPDSLRLDLIEGMVARGFGDRIVLGLDLGTRDYYRAYEGGPGMRYLMATFVPRLRKRIGDAATDAILVANPARLYAVARA